MIKKINGKDKKSRQYFVCGLKYQTRVVQYFCQVNAKILLQLLIYLYLFQGYGFPRKFIASQGPKEVTLNDFWRMVWEQNSYTIIMITELRENAKVINLGCLLFYCLLLCRFEQKTTGFTQIVNELCKIVFTVLVLYDIIHCSSTTSGYF